MIGIDMHDAGVDGFRVGGIKKRSSFSKWCLLGGISLALGSAGGCEIDCDERYCDFVRAAAGGIYAWEYQCCLEPDSPACEDRALRYQTLAFSAPSMRMACEQRNWDRVGEIWHEVKRVLPAMPLRLIIANFCGFDIGFGENVATPFAAGDAVMLDVSLASAGSNFPWIDQSGHGRRGSTGGSASTMRSAANRSGWVVRGDSIMEVQTRGATARFDVTGIFSAVESVGRGDDVDDWCRSLHPDELRLLLTGSDGTIRIDLDPTFEGNAMVFTEPDAGVIGVAVRIVMNLEGPLLLSAPFELDAAFLELPFRIEPDGELRLGSEGAIDAFDLWPVASLVEAYIVGQNLEDEVGGEDQSSCAVAARVVADHFLNLHESECGGNP